MFYIILLHERVYVGKEWSDVKPKSRFMGKKDAEEKNE